MDFSPQHPIEIQRLRNQIGEVGLTGKTLEGRDNGTDSINTPESSRRQRFYFITEVVTSGAGTATYINARGESCSKTLASGRTIWANPWGGSSVVLPSVVTEYSGFWLAAGQ